MIRMVIQYEMFVGSIRIHADSRRSQCAMGCRYKPPQNSADVFSFFHRHFAVNRVGIGSLPFVMNGNFDPVPQIRKSIKEPMRGILPDMNRAALCIKIISQCIWLEPEEDLSFNS